MKDNGSGAYSTGGTSDFSTEGYLSTPEGVTEALYYYSDEHVHDRQSTSAFEEANSGWRAEYDAEHDIWDVWTPSGLYRSYRRVTV